MAQELVLGSATRRALCGNFRVPGQLPLEHSVREGEFNSARGYVVGLKKLMENCMVWGKEMSWTAGKGDLKGGGQLMCGHIEKVQDHQVDLPLAPARVTHL